ncbi:MAG: Crp/Fnr family transcriptional regulator [Clostridiales bacterium]|nr:Crp/Fnr family transcriptional regulator [Clostridiales bacterium]
MVKTCQGNDGCCCSVDSCVRRVDIFSMLPESKLQEVAALVRHREYEQKDTLFSLGDAIAGIYIIRHGAVKLQREDADGHERIVNILRVGDFYGGDSLFYDSHSQETAVALEPTGICFIGEADLRSLLTRDPEIALKIIQYYSARHVRDMNMLEILSTGDIMRRVSRFLVWQSQNVSQSRVSLSQEEMAAMLGITAETLNRKLAILKKEGIIRVVGHRGIEIVRPQRMQEYS